MLADLKDIKRAHSRSSTRNRLQHIYIQPVCNCEMQSFNLTAYRWWLVGLDLAYVFLGFAAAKEDKYPASRHRDTFTSKCWVGTHIVLGAVVIYGGATIFILDNQRISVQHCTWVLRLIAVVALLHAMTVPGMLAKVPGCRKLTVSYYVGVTTINVYTAVVVLCTPSVHNLLLLWGSLSAFVYVRFFVFAFYIVSGGADFMVVYTLAMGLAGYFATIANGLNGLSLLIIASPVVVAPLMVSYNRWFHNKFASEISHESGGVLFKICSAVHRALDPVDVPHQPSFKTGWYRSMNLWFAADHPSVAQVTQVPVVEFTVKSLNANKNSSDIDSGSDAV